MSEINNTQVDNAKGIYVVMPMYNLIEYSNNYSEPSGSLQQYKRNEPALNVAGAVTDFPAANNNSLLFGFKTEIASKTGKRRGNSTNQAKILVLLKYLSIENP